MKDVDVNVEYEDVIFETVPLGIDSAKSSLEAFLEHVCLSYFPPGIDRIVHSSTLNTYTRQYFSCSNTRLGAGAQCHAPTSNWIISSLWSVGWLIWTTKLSRTTVIITRKTAFVGSHWLTCQTNSWGCTAYVALTEVTRVGAGLRRRLGGWPMSISLTCHRRG